MKLEELVPGMAIVGPTGIVYKVMRIEGRWAVLRTPYPVIGAEGYLCRFIKADQVALDRFAEAQPGGDLWPNSTPPVASANESPSGGAAAGSTSTTTSAT